MQVGDDGSARIMQDVRLNASDGVLAQVFPAGDLVGAGWQAHHPPRVVRWTDQRLSSMIAGWSPTPRHEKCRFAVAFGECFLSSG